MESVLLYLKNLLSLNDTVVVATSGGPDSMFLLHALKMVREAINFKIVVIHINHHLRSESDSEKEFVSEFCQKNNIIFEYREIKEYNDNVEADARRKRYQYFKEVVNKYQAKFLMTAHHGDDLMETILMRLVRGSSIKGYSGFKMETDVGNFKLIRPLITLTKDEIIKYMDLNNYEYVVDKSNFSRDYTRNRYRMDILPLLKKENKNVHLKFLKFSEKLGEVNSFLERYIKEILNNIKDSKGLKIDELLKLDDFLLKKVLEYELSLIYIDNLYLVSDKHILNIIKVIKNNKSNLSINLPNNVLVKREYNYLKFVYNKEECNSFNYIVETEVKVSGGVIRRINNSNLKSNNIIRLNSKDITLPIRVRNRYKGDKIEVKNLGGSKKVKDIFIDSKVSREKRESFPIVTDSDNRVLWLPGVKKSKFDVECDGIYDIILSYEEE